LLAADGVVRKGSANEAAHLLLDAAICDRHRSAVRLARHLERHAEVLPCYAARHLGELLGECESCGKVRMLDEAHRRSDQFERSTDRNTAVPRDVMRRFVR